MMTSDTASADAAQKQMDANGTDFVLIRKGQIKPHALIAEVRASTNRVRGRKRTKADVFIDFVPKH